MHARRFMLLRALPATAARRRLLPTLIVLTLLVSSAVTLTAPAATAASTPAAPAIDLANPEATVNDPAGGLSPVNTDCGPGQVDLNRASSAQLSAALGIPSAPTIGRLIALRPWLKEADLSAVPGIGPSKAAAVAAKTCATQPDPGTSQPRACTSTSQVDLNSASAADIASLLGLPDVAAQALVSARPLPQNLSQIIAPRIPGFPQPKVDTLTQQGRICVTPAPYNAGGTLYRWISPAGGAVIRNNGFALIVPPGRVNGTGAYGGVTPLAPDAGVLPHADYHIFGDWNSGVTTVAVQGPYIAAGQPGGPAVLHNAADGMRLSIGDSTAVSTVNGQPTVTALATSLSDVTFGYTKCRASNGLFLGGSPSCLQSLTDGSLKQAWLDNAAAAGQQTGRSLLDQTHCGDIGTGHVVTGSLPFGMSCDQSFDSASGNVTWTMTNKAYVSAPLGLVNGAVIYNYSTQGGQYVNPPTLNGGAEDNLLLKMLIGYASPTLRWVFAGQALHVTKTQGFLTTTVNVNSNPLATAVWNGLTNILSVLGNQEGQNLLATAINDLGLVGTVNGCITNLSTDSLGCLKGVVEQTVEYLETSQAAAKYGLAAADSAFYATGGIFFKWFAAAQWAASFASSVAFQHIGGTGVTLSDQPPAPARDSQGRLVNAVCLSHDDVHWIIDLGCQNAEYATGATPVPGSGGTGTGLPAGRIVRDPAGHAYFVNQDAATIAPIGQPSTYLCLAKHYIVDWNYDPLAVGNNRYSAYTQISGEPACDPNAAPTSAVTQPNLVRALDVLREPDGTAWVVDGTNGQGFETRVHITSGQEFNCWVSPAPGSGTVESNLWDQVTPDELANYPVSAVITSVSNCPGGF